MKRPKVTVLGSFVVDLMGRAPHLPVPGETVKGSIFKMGPGGKGSNQGVAAHRAGAEVTMITKVGKDIFGEIALTNFKNEGMDTSYVYQDDKYPSGAALIMVDENTSQNKILVTLGACEYITRGDIMRAEHDIKNSNIFLTQLETNVDAVENAINIACENKVKVVLNPAPVQIISDELLKKVDVFTPNEVEASILSNIDIKTKDDVAKTAEFFLDKGVKNVIITLGADGAYIATQSKKVSIPSIKVKVVDTTGAGDAFNGGLATALAEGKDIFEAAIFANIVAGLSVTKIGTAPAMPFRKDIEEFIENNKIKY